MIEYATDHIIAYGHPNIKATHRTTLEITTEDYLTPRGDCIIAIKADKAAKHLSPRLKNLLKKDNTILIIQLEAQDIKDTIIAQGSRHLTLTSPTSIVIRKSTYIDDRTIAIKASKAAKNISRKLINYLKNKQQIINIRLIAIHISQESGPVA